MEIRDIPEDKRLRQLAEECSEGAQAALKLIRAYEGEKQLDKTACRFHLIEELADITVCTNAILTDVDRIAYFKYIGEKAKRWKERLNGLSKS
jgi:hypothetical protein